MPASCAAFQAYSRHGLRISYPHIQTTGYYLSSANDFSGNGSCQISGVADGGSKPANGCTEVP